MMCRLRLFVAALWVAFLTPVAWGQSCTKTAEVCVDGPSTKDVNGVSVYRDCWQYTDTYECLTPNSVDYCAGVRNMPGCVQSGSTCVQRGASGECLEFTNTYRCESLIDPPPGVIQLDTEYTITNDATDRAACATHQDNPRCSLAQQTCIEPGGTRVIDGLEVTRDCWAWQEAYACVAMESDCQALSGDSACTLTSTVCEDRNDDGTCALTAHTYTCETDSGQTEVTTCNGGTFCLNGLCFGQPAGNDRDFAIAVTMMEAGRQAAGYAVDPSSLKFFTGESQQCSRNPLSNCCRTNTRGADKSNGAMISTVMQAGKQAWGSWYVYDALSRTTRSVDALGALLGSSAFSEGFSGFDTTNFVEGFNYYGVGINTAATSASQFFTFDPWSFAAAVAIQLLQEALACEQEEEVLAMQRGQNLCTYVGSYCSQRFLGSCVSRRSTYCCFNSKLGRIIQEQGRSQLGIDWGTAEAPNCDGLTQEQFQQIDFSSIDFSEFIEDIARNVQMPDVTGIQTENQQLIQDRVENYFNQ